MQYMLLIYEDETGYGPGKAGPEMQAVVARHMALVEEMGPVRLAGNGLRGTGSATTLRTTGGKAALHDGPYAETKEQLGGYYLIEAPDLDAALAWARKVPLRADGAIEVRPVITRD